MGTYLRALGECYQMNANMTGFVFKNRYVLKLWAKVALALEGLIIEKRDKDKINKTLIHSCLKHIEKCCLDL